MYLIYSNGFSTYIVKKQFNVYSKIEINTNGYASLGIACLNTSNIPFLTVDGINGTDSSSIKNANKIITELLNNGIIFNKENVCDTNSEVQNQLESLYFTLYSVVGSKDLSIDEIVDIESIIKNKTI